jgi:hypothetical protein
MLRIIRNNFLFRNLYFGRDDWVLYTFLIFLHMKLTLEFNACENHIIQEIIPYTFWVSDFSSYFVFFPSGLDRICRYPTSCQHCNETIGVRLTTAAIRSGFYRNFGEYIRSLRSERRLRKGIVFKPKAINDIWDQ